MSLLHTRNRITGARWERMRWRVFERDGWRCLECGAAGRLECDHRIPMDRGGKPWDINNLQSLCRGCHIAKTRKERRFAQVGPKVRAWRNLVAELV